MKDLTPEERHRIYLEEKTRMEVRNEMEPKKTHWLGWTLVVVLTGFLLLLFAGIASEISKSPEELAKDRARECVTTWQWRFSERGYTVANGNVAAIMQCTAELQALKYESQK